MAHKIIGVDTGSHGIKVSKVIPNTKGFQIEDTKLYQKTGETYFTTVKTIFEEEKSSFFVMGLKNLNVYKRVINLPFLDKSKVLQALPFQIEQKLPLKMDTMHYDYNLVKDKELKNSRVSVYALNKEEFSEYFNTFKDMPVKLRAMLPDTLAYKYLYHALNQPLTAFLDIGATTTRFLIFKDEEIISDISIKIGGQNIDETIATTFDVDFDKAREAKEKISEIFEKEINQDESRLVIEKIIKEKVDYILNILDIELKKVNLKESIPLYLVGGGARIVNLSSYLESRLNVSVQRTRLWSDPIYAKSIGYALRETQYVKDCKVNFLKGDFALKSSESGVIPKNTWLYLIYLVVLVALFFTYQNFKYKYYAGKIESIESNTQKISQRLIKDDFYDPTELLSIVSGADSATEKVIPEHTAYDHLSNISKLLLDARVKLDVKDINIIQKQISMTTYVDNIETIDQLVEVLKKDKCYKSIKKGKSKKNKKTDQIRITLTINNLDC